MISPFSFWFWWTSSKCETRHSKRQNISFCFGFFLHRDGIVCCACTQARKQCPRPPLPRSTLRSSAMVKVAAKMRGSVLFGGEKAVAGGLAKKAEKKTAKMRGSVLLAGAVTWMDKMGTPGCARCQRPWSSKNRGFRNVCLVCHHANNYADALAVSPVFSDTWRRSLVLQLVGMFPEFQGVEHNPDHPCLQTTPAHKRGFINALWTWSEDDEAPRRGIGFVSGI